MYKHSENTLHTRNIPPHHVRVSINVVQQQEENVQLPVPNEDENLVTLRDAIGTYVAWPAALISLQQQVYILCSI